MDTDGLPPEPDLTPEAGLGDVNGLERFLRLCAQEMGQLASTPAERAGSDALRSAIATGGSMGTLGRSVPLEAALDEVESNPLTVAFLACREALPWAPSHRMSDGGTEAALCTLNDAFDLGDLTAGLLLVGAGCRYPEHRHGPQELYLTLSGSGAWRFGGRYEYRTVPPRELIYNHPNDLHGMVASELPVLALYVLWP